MSSISSLADVISALESGSRPKGGVNGLSHGVPSLGGEHIASKGGFRFDNLKLIPDEFFQQMDKGRIQPHDILVVKDGATTGKTSLVRPDFPYERAAVNEHVFIVRVDATKADPRYVFHYLFSDRGQQDIRKDFRGATVGGISRGFVERVQFPLPPLSEQKRIADILDKADAIRRKRQEAIGNFDDLSDSLFKQVSHDADVEPRSISDLLESKVLLVHKDGNYGGSYPRKHEFGAVGIPFLSAKHVAADGTLVKHDVPRLNEDKARTLPFGWIERGDVLLAHNATVGPVALYQGDYEEALIGTSLTCYRPNPKHLKSEFLFAALRGSHFQRQLQKEMSQTTRNQVPITAQRKLTLHVPSLSVQQQFAGQLSRIHSLRTKHVEAVSDAQLLFNSLVQRAFRGDL